MKSMQAGGILGLQAGNCNTIYYGQAVRQLQGHVEYVYAASGIQKHYSPDKLDFLKRHAGGGPETKD